VASERPGRLGYAFTPLFWPREKNKQSWFSQLVIV